MAKFPAENPHPVLRISHQGEILYANGPGTIVLDYWQRKVGQMVPAYWYQLVTDVINKGANRVEEIRHRDHTYSLVLTAIAGMNYMNMYGRDITAQRKAEQELRQSHDQLQVKVRERTAELGRMVKILQDEVRQRIEIETQLRESSELLDAFFSHSLTPLVILDRSFNFVRVNEAYAQGCQREISEFAGRNHFELYPNVENQKIFETVVQTKVPYQVTGKPFTFPDHPEWGVTYWDWNLNPLLDETGEVEYLVFSLRDVTQRKQAEMALQESEEQYRHLVELLPEAVFVISQEKITYFNQAALHILKVAGEEHLLGTSIRDFVLPASMECLNEILQRVHVHQGKIAPREIQVKCLDGSMIEVEISAAPIQLSGIPGDLVIFRDITEQKYQQQLIRQSEMRLSEAQHIAHLGNWEWDLASDEIWCSDEVYSIFGLAPQDTRLTLELIIAHTHPEDRDLVRRAIEETRSQGKGFLLHHRIVLMDQTERTVQVRAEHHGQSPVQQPGLRGTIQDVTEQKKIEAELRESQRKLRSLASELEKVGEKERRQIAVDLHDSIGQILAFSARELKGLQKILPEHFSQTVQEVTKQLDLAVKQTRTLSFDLSPSILYDLGLEQALEELTERFSAEKKISYTYESDGLEVSLPDPIKILLYRAVRELLVNVCKHAQATRVKVSLCCNEQQIQIRVEDNGQGLGLPAPAVLPKQDKGFGLYSIGERLDHIGGKLEMESSPGRGLKVLLTVPLAMEPNLL
ncbi:MAG: Oxygen sensor histidine kinase NreB [Planctomycetes bacterium ADurb.Bin412]|nr:MAG: Oxygen sensor histidine kinase NreB [Planctomycetes bacterium ADurb.Bin412]